MTDTGPGFLHRLLSAVGRGLRAIFRPAVIVSVAAVVAAAALVVVAVEQREQTDWQRRQTCLAWYRTVSADNAAIYSREGTDIGEYLSNIRAIAAVRCGGSIAPEAPGADTSADVDRQVQDLIDASEAETGD